VACAAILLVVALVVFGVSGCRRSADGQSAKMAAMSKDIEARCDVVQKYLIERGMLKSETGTALCVEGIMSTGGWPFRIVRIGETGKVTAVGSGTFDIEHWSLSAQAVPQSTGSATLGSILDFTLPSSEVNKIRNTWGARVSHESGTAAVRRVLFTRGWLGDNKALRCLWFDKDSRDDWITFYLDGTVWSGLSDDLIVCALGRVNVKDNSVEFNPAVMF
jgi:hypothetical protein